MSRQAGPCRSCRTLGVRGNAVDWEPISEAGLWDRIIAAEARMDPEVARFWEGVRVPPEKWAQHPYGDVGGGFWVVGLVGTTVLWFNDIEDGFNSSRYVKLGHIDEYWCDQHELDVALVRLLTQIKDGTPMLGRASEPKSGAYRDA